jgi:hypothetical protein
VIEQFAALANFSDKEADSVGLPRLVQLDDVRVIQLLEYRNFVLKRFIVLNSALLHGLYCDLHSSLLVLCQVHSSVATAP